jgi:hypothetical protein
VEGQRGCRLPGQELERAVAIAAWSILNDKAVVLEALQVAGIADVDINQIFTLVTELRAGLLAEMERSTALVELVEEAVLTDEGIRLGLNIPESICSARSGDSSPTATASSSAHPTVR